VCVNRCLGAKDVMRMSEDMEVEYMYVSRKRLYDEIEDVVEVKREIKRRRVCKNIRVLRSVCFVLGGVEGICVGMSRVSMKSVRRVDNMSMRSMKMCRVLDKKLKKK
jgi:hypothetical protein